MILPGNRPIYLREGEMFISSRPATVRTVLGSCVAVTMFHRKLKIGAIFHSLLPQCTDREVCGDCTLGFRFVECSIRKTASAMERYGAKSDQIEIKVFGGADMALSRDNGVKITNVGRQNIMTALDVIRAEGLKVTASDLGGSEGRKIIFYSHTGEVFLKRVKNPHAALNGNSPERIQ